MYENLAAFPGGPPTPELLRLYELWALGGWGIILTGNVQISMRHRGLGRDLLLNARAPSARERELYTAMARKMKDAPQPAGELAPLAIMQLNHAGASSCAPAAVPVRAHTEQDASRRISWAGAGRGTGLSPRARDVWARARRRASPRASSTGCCSRRRGR